MKIIAFLSALLAPFASAKEVTGVASWYGAEYNGRPMANGQPFDHRAKTLATYAFPLGTKVKITYKAAGGLTRVAYGTVTDRGPNKPGRKFDLSWSLFKVLETPHRGLITVTVSEVTK